MGKYYAVANGRNNGVYGSWSECKDQVSGYSGAKFKSFATKSEANAFASGGSSSSSSSSSSRSSGSSSRSSYSGSSSRSSYSGSSSSSYSRRSSGGSSGGYSGRYSDGYSGGSSSGSSSGYSSSRSYGSSSGSSGSRSDSQVIYTDGSSLGNGKRGAKAGWGVFWSEGDSRNKSGKVSTGEQTNNRGELQAINEAVRTISHSKGSTKSYEIRADSQYARDALSKWGDKWESNGWKTSGGGSVKNQDLIQSTRDQIKDLRSSGIDVKIKYVEGHAGHAGNEAADKLARDAAGK